MRKLVQGSGFKMVSPLKLDNQTETNIDKDSLASDQAFDKIFQDYQTADKIGNPSEQDRWKEFLMENYSRSYNADKGRIEYIQPSNPEPGQDNFPSEEDVQAVDPKFRVPERFSWEAYNKKFPRK